MPVASVSGAKPVAVTNQSSSGAAFRKEIPGATRTELFELIKAKLQDLGDGGQATVTIDEASSTVTAKRTSFPRFALRLIAEDGALEARIDQYPPIKGDLLDKKVVQILERAPAKLEEARASGWQPTKR